MSTMNISLPSAMKAFIDRQVETRGFGSGSEDLRELVRRDQERAELRASLLEGAASPVDDESIEKHLAGLRQLARKTAKRSNR